MSMEEITNLYTEINGLFACIKCNYQSKRKDNLKRHINEKHLSKKVKCTKCGNVVTKSALSRHKRLACKVACPQISKPPATTVNDQTLTNTAISIEKRTIPLNLEVIKLSDGKVIIKSDHIEIDGLFFQLVQRKGKLIIVENGQFVCS